MILCISKFKRIDFMLNVPMTHTQTHTYIKTKGHRLLGEVMDMSVTLIVVMVSWMFVYVQNYWDIQIIYVQFFVYKLYLSKAVKKNKSRDRSTKHNDSFGELQTIQSDCDAEEHKVKWAYVENGFAEISRGEMIEDCVHLASFSIYA